MPRLINRSHLPSVPLSFAVNGTKLYVQARQSFESFYDMVVRFARANQQQVPPVQSVENALCKQMAKGWCTDAQPNTRTSIAPPPIRRTGGCKTCGRR